ncbi:hypothetical protein K402DRAFT_417229 [Aulographum hederae CBS 113979]|uniref:CASTOR ACT domain-containing protein n=1 Tax=Aulographum hederae CBS 113979 TaxID=1176131 RepID=A0A6G1HDM6_9PEZI|nr:hypothetical protein K402DRAFT_417229 [Aulographum hederae CBS 113979]
MLNLQDTQLALIHIPIELYTLFLEPILQLLLPNRQNDSTVKANGTTNGTYSRPRRSWAYVHPFVNISITSIECSIACSRTLAQELFVPAIESLDAASREKISITKDNYIVMQVDGEGLDAGQRVLELTSPLAMAGISIFFITTYFSDYILVPHRCRGQVIHALEERGFAFETNADAYVNPSSHVRNASTNSSLDSLGPPSTPPPATISELQTRTFATLNRHNIQPTVDADIRLIQFSARKDSGSSSTLATTGGSWSASGATEDRLHLGLVRCLISRPRFLSITLTDSEPASLLLEEHLLCNFDRPAPNRMNGGAVMESVLLGNREDVLVPIVLDLRTMPTESTGIVCGVAGRLVGRTADAIQDSVEMSYLSTAKAGTVMVSETDLERALEALKGPENQD